MTDLKPEIDVICPECEHTFGASLATNLTMQRALERIGSGQHGAGAGFVARTALRKCGLYKDGDRLTPVCGIGGCRGAHWPQNHNSVVSGGSDD